MAEQTRPRRGYAVGVQMFDWIRERGSVYVDKTEYVWKMVSTDAVNFFLSASRCWSIRCAATSRAARSSSRGCTSTKRRRNGSNILSSVWTCRMANTTRKKRCIRPSMLYWNSRKRNSASPILLILKIMMLVCRALFKLPTNRRASGWSSSSTSMTRPCSTASTTWICRTTSATVCATSSRR